MIGIEDKLTDAFGVVANSKPIPPLPVVATAAKTHRTRSALRRSAMVCAGTLAVAGMGLGVAAATGVPLGFSWGDPVEGAFNAKSETSRLVATTQDADGQRLQLWIADATDHGYCLAFVHPDESRPYFDQRDGGGCSGAIGDRYWNMFGENGVASGGTFAQHVPGAVRLDMVLSDGTSISMPLGEGWTVGDLNRHQETLHPELVGYNADGTEVGRAPVIGTH